jgi:microcystin-dependent protein
MSCKNCFNGCASTTSDKCVKYTGIDVPDLGIENGDSLASVQDNIINNLLSSLDGTGIVMTIDSGDLCALVSGYLPGSGEITLVDYISALLQSACILQTQVTTEKNRIDTIEANYTLDCITGVTASAGTHDILQAVISFLCTLDATVTALALNLSTNYTTTADLPALIVETIGEEPETSLYKTRMVPMTVVEYYGSVGNFDGSGAGLGDWIDIYLCNGANGTPDKRGRVGVGTTTGMNGGAMSPAVDPAVVGNPAYTLLSTGGTNTVTISMAQMPSHNHTGTFTGTPHLHSIDNVLKAGGATSTVLTNQDNVGHTVITSTGSTTAGGTITINNTGSGEAHENIQPGLGCYYIMYIPS